MGTTVRLRKHNSLYCQVDFQGERFLLVKPLTFMNRSGHAVRPWLANQRIALENTLVIYDDLTLPLGRLRMRPSGSAGGHNGMKSLIASLNSDTFPRLRLGIGPRPEEIDAADFVLQKWLRNELPTVEQVLAVVPEIVMCWLHEGLTQAIDRYNGWTAEP